MFEYLTDYQLPNDTCDRYQAEFDPIMPCISEQYGLQASLPAQKSQLLQEFRGLDFSNFWKKLRFPLKNNIHGNSFVM